MPRHRSTVARRAPSLAPPSPATTGWSCAWCNRRPTGAGDFGGDLEGEYRRTVAALPGLAERLVGAQLVGKVRSATNLVSYFRRSSGPGWALAGDAGHFKDPVTAQGIRDALRYGRRLGEVAGPLLEDRPALDAALRAWEHERERDCLEVYQWTNALARGLAPTALEIELHRLAAENPELVGELLDVFSRLRRPSDVADGRRALRLTGRALTRRGADRRQVLRDVAGDALLALADARVRRTVTEKNTRQKATGVKRTTAPA